MEMIPHAHQLSTRQQISSLTTLEGAMAYLERLQVEIPNADNVVAAKLLTDRAEALQFATRRVSALSGCQIEVGRCVVEANTKLGELLPPPAPHGGDRKSTAHTAIESLSGAAKKAEIGRKKARTARKLADVPKDKRDKAIAELEAKGEAPTVDGVLRIAGKAQNAERNAQKQPLQLPEGKYAVILADPPWRYEFAETQNREIENQYPTMTLEDLCELPVSGMAADDSVLFLWTTSPKLQESFAVIEAWGFRYVTSMVWDKEVIGMGYYFRQQHELLLVAKRGALPVPEPSTRVSSVLRAKRGKHSAKPDEVYAVLEAMYPACPRLELFCRSPRAGWTAWGNEPCLK